MTVFPEIREIGDKFVSNGISYEWSGEKWKDSRTTGNQYIIEYDKNYVIETANTVLDIENYNSFTLDTSAIVESNINIEIPTNTQAFDNILFQVNYTPDFTNTWILTDDYVTYENIMFNTSSQDNTTTGLTFSPNGKKMYIIGQSTYDIHQYDLSTAWDISTATYISTLITSHTLVRNVHISPDGQTIIVGGPNKIQQFNLSVPWEISSGVSVGSTNYPSPSYLSYGLYIKPDGTKMYVGDTVNSSSSVIRIYEIDITSWETAYTSMSYSGNYVNVSDNNDNNNYNLFFKSDGSKMYVETSGTISTYDLVSNWDLSQGITISSDVPPTFSVTMQNGFFIREDGTKLYTIDNNDNIYQHALGDVNPLTINWGDNIKFASGTPPTIDYSYDTTILLELINSNRKWISNILSYDLRN